MEQQITAMWAQVVATAGVGLVKCGLIAWGLRLLSRSGERGDRQLDVMTKALERQGDVLAELLRRTE